MRLLYAVFVPNERYINQGGIVCPILKTFPYQPDRPQEVATMLTLILIIPVVLHALLPVLEELDNLVFAFRAVMNSWPGIVALISVTAWQTYRWYRDRYIG